MLRRHRPPAHGSPTWRIRWPPSCVSWTASRPSYRRLVSPSTPRLSSPGGIAIPRELGAIFNGGAQLAGHSGLTASDIVATLATGGTPRLAYDSTLFTSCVGMQDWQPPLKLTPSFVSLLRGYQLGEGGITMAHVILSSVHGATCGVRPRLPR